MDETYNFETRCRLCAQEQEATILIFSAEAEAFQLQNKLNKYLLIEVDEDDMLPKSICTTCCSKLQMVCDFIDTARKSQDILLEQMTLLEQKEQTLSQIKIENESCSYNNTKLNSIEVNVDPMIVLQNSEEGGEVAPPSDDEACKQNESDAVRYLQGDVTIKLIKSGETEPDGSVDTDRTEDNDSSKPFACVLCNRRYQTELALKSHSWIHNEDQNTGEFVCQTCGAHCETKGVLLLHMKKHDTTNNLCQICGRVFRTQKNLAIHMANHKSAKKSYTCTICGRSYNTQSNLRNHSVAHSTERPYICHICKKGFKRNQDLKFHLNQHTGAKPYKCTFCDKSFASAGNCYTHRTRMHLHWNTQRVRRCTLPHEKQPLLTRTAGTKTKYQCTLCSHTFLRRDNYMYHMYQHTGKKPFQCPFCSEEFVTRKGLCLHHEVKHPGKDRSLGLLSKNVLLQ